MNMADLLHARPVTDANAVANVRGNTRVKRPVGSIHQRFADLAWLASRSFGTTDAGDVMAVNLKTLDFSPLSEFLVGTASLGCVRRSAVPSRS